MSRSSLARTWPPRWRRCGELLPPPGEGDDGDAEWQAALVDRYATVRPFIELLASVIPWGCTDAGARILAALRGLPKVMAARKPGADHVHGFEDLVTGSWQRLVFAGPRLEAPLISRPGPRDLPSAVDPSGVLHRASRKTVRDDRTAVHILSSCGCFRSTSASHARIHGSRSR